MFLPSNKNLLKSTKNAIFDDFALTFAASAVIIDVQSI